MRPVFFSTLGVWRCVDFRILSPLSHIPDSCFPSFSPPSMVGGAPRLTFLPFQFIGFLLRLLKADNLLILFSWPTVCRWFCKTEFPLATTSKVSHKPDCGGVVGCCPIFFLWHEQPMMIEVPFQFLRKIKPPRRGRKGKKPMEKGSW